MITGIQYVKRVIIVVTIVMDLVLTIVLNVQVQIIELKI